VTVHGLHPELSTFDWDVRDLSENTNIGQWIHYEFDPEKVFSRRGFEAAALDLIDEICNSRQGLEKVT